MVEIAHEAPIPHIGMVQASTDFDFAIAHFAKESRMYTHKYANRSKGRRLILDNGKFELGAPLPLIDILKIAEEIKADYVIPPDHFENFDATRRSLDVFLKTNRGAFKVAPVVVGSSPIELATCYEWYKTIEEIDMYCWSFLYNRAIAMTLINGVDKTKPHHLLGFSTLSEFRECKGLLNTPLSIDTMKPISATFCNAALVDDGRGKYKRPTLYDWTSNIELLEENIKKFREWLKGENGELAG